MGKTSRTGMVEIHEFYVIRSASGSLPRFALCSTGDAIMVAPELAAAIAAVPVRTIYLWVGPKRFTTAKHLTALR